MAELHTCELDAKVCKTCKLEAHGDEKCKLVRRPLDMTVPKLLFAAVSFVDPTPFNCQECYDKDEYCSYHKISYQDCGKQFAYPNYLVTLREKYFHGSFVREDYGHHLLDTLYLGVGLYHNGSVLHHGGLGVHNTNEYTVHTQYTVHSTDR